MQYRTGTVSVTNGSATVTGDISFWVAEVEPGDLFLIQGENTSYEVASVASNTQLTLTAPYGGATGTGKAYVIARDFTPTLNIPVVGSGDVETATINKRAWMKVDNLAGVASVAGKTGVVTLAGADITSGALSDARLSSNVPLKNAANVFTQPQEIQTNSPYLLWDEQDQAANERLVMVQAASKNFAISFRSDDLATAGGILTAFRGTGVAVSSIDIGNSTDLAPIAMRGQGRAINGSAGAPGWSYANDTDSGWYLNAPGDVRLSVGGADKMAIGTVYSPNLQIRMLTNPVITNVDPIQWYEETDAPADNRIWYTRANSQQFRAGAYDDAISGTGIWLSVERTNANIDSIAFSTVSAGAITLDTGELQFVQSDGIITRNSNSGRVVAAGGDGNNVANGAVLRLEGIDFGGAGTGGNAQLMASSGKTLSLTATSGTLVLSSSSTTVSGATTLTHESTASNPTLRLQANAPRFHIWESDAAANNREWVVTAVSEQLRFLIQNDDGTGAANWMTVDRTGNTVDSLALTATSITLNGVASSDFARLSQSNTFGGNVVLSNSSIGLRWNATGAPADQKRWRFIVSANGTLSLDTENDVGVFTENAIVLTRSGADVASITLSATDIVASGKFKATGNVGFNNVTPVAKPTVSGSRGGNAALASLLTALANYGLVTDSTSA